MDLKLRLEINDLEEIKVNFVKKESISFFSLKYYYVVV